MARSFEASPGFSAARRRRQQQRWWFLGKLAAAAAVGLFSLGAAYEVGLSQSRVELERSFEDRETERLKVQRLTAQLARVEQAKVATTPETTSHTPTSTTSTIGPALERVLQAATAKIEQGVTAERLVRALALVKAERACDPTVESKRANVSTPVSRTGTEPTFAAGKLKVTVKGAAARNAAGRMEAWFDPSQPIELSLIQTGQPPLTTIGTIPMVHGFVIDHREHLFEVKQQDRRGMVEISLRVCDYP